MKKLYFAILVFSFLTALTQKVDAAVRYVKAGGTGNGSGWITASGNLQTIINMSSDGDEIWVGVGTYTGSFDTQGKNLKLYGGFDNNQGAISLRVPGMFSTLDGASSNRVLVATKGLVLDGFIIQNGRTLDVKGGGGVYIEGEGTFNINNCRFFSNYAKYNGGALSIENKLLAMTTLEINRCVFSGNKADMNGGGIFIYPVVKMITVMKIKINNTLISGNAATGINRDADAEDNQLVKYFFDRYSGSGGAIFCVGATNGDLDINSSTIAGNLSTQRSGDLFYAHPLTGITTLPINNTIYTDSNNAYHILPSGNNNIIGTDPKFEAPVSPALAPTTLGSYSLSNCSPAINAGSNTLYPINIEGYDVMKNERFYGQIDIGAFEYQGTPNQNQNILYVDANSTYHQGASDVGTAGNKALKDLGIALLYASERGCTSEIRVAQGTYYSSTFTRSSFFWSRSGYFSITGGYPTGFTSERNPTWYPTVINGDFQNDGNSTNNNHHLMVLTSNQTQLYGNLIDGFTFENGYADNNIPYNDPDFAAPFPQNEGAAIYINNMSPKFRNCVFKQNYATIAGGSIVVNNGNPTFTNCRFEGNTAGTGGAVKINNQSKVIFNSCDFTTNTANITHGGAVLVDQTSHATFIGTRFNTNVANSEGGAIYHQNGGTLTLEKSVFKDNAAKYGGAVRLINGNMDFSANANVFNGNTAHENGAGALSIIPGNGKTVITNNIFTGNQTLQGTDNQVSGGGSIVQEGGNGTYIINNTFYNEKAYSGASSVHFKSGGTDRFLQNNIFYQNITTTGINQNWNTAGGTTATVSNNLENTNPIFVNAANPIGADNIWGTADDGLKLQNSSPAINQGIANNATATDIIGNERIQDGVIDIGAYEMAPTVLPVTLASFTAKLENNTAVLRWETSSETNNASFEIFRSADGKNFVSLTTVAGKGTTASKNSYTWHDRNPLNGINYYKLVQKDNDGKTEELGIRPLTFSLNGEEIIFYPNPVREKANVRFTAGIYKNIIISDINGRIVQSTPLNQNDTEKIISMENLSYGTYFLRLQGDGKKAVLKVIKN